MLKTNQQYTIKQTNQNCSNMLLLAQQESQYREKQEINEMMGSINIDLIT